VKLLQAGLLILALAGTACVTYDRGTLAAVSTASLSMETTVVAENVVGKSCREVFDAPIASAIEDALRNAPGANALVDVSYRYERFCMVVRGTAVRVP